MPEFGEPAAPPGVVSTDDPEDEERRCPVCDALWVKTEPTLGQVRTAIGESFEAHRADVKALSEGAMAGYCGSVATGFVGNPDKPHYDRQPDIRGECGTKYDVDGFVITSFAGAIRKFKGKRWGSKNPTTRALEKKMRATLAGKPALAHMKGGKSGFSLVLYTPNEERKAAGKGGIVLVR